ncbi:RIO1 family-domain-containing protein [Tribonema minus]|uniref:Serine/threonine-protein kinase RIO1 n=1 Tax=Tribonema minus TaxID=303371 RepID=A0A835YHG6_9STRA|nr:RIO1 family-domain-containing protein [Tribonema minus]
MTAPLAYLPVEQGQFEDEDAVDAEAVTTNGPQSTKSEGRRAADNAADAKLIAAMLFGGGGRAGNAAEEEHYEDYDEGKSHDDELAELETELLGEGSSVQASMARNSKPTTEANSHAVYVPMQASGKSAAHSVSNDIKRSEKASDKQARHTGRDDRATSEQVMDPRTRLILFKLLNSGFISKIDGCLSTGKEANVYYAVAGSKGASITGEFAIKVHMLSNIFKTSILVFKDRDKYVSGEFRYRHGYCRSNPRKMVKVWAEKEMRNLRRLTAAGIPSPAPVMVKSNVLVMEFLGENGWPAPRQRMQEMYDQCITHMTTMYRECRLVHGDLSEYNMLYHQGRLYIIDVSQSMEQDHPHALDFLRMDCRNVNDFFKRQGADIVGTHDLFDLIRDTALAAEDVVARIKQLQVDHASRESGNKEEVDEAVFMSSFIPRSLYQLDNCEAEAQQIADGGREHVYTKAVAQMLSTAAAPVLSKEQVRTIPDTLPTPPPAAVMGRPMSAAASAAPEPATAAAPTAVVAADVATTEGDDPAASGSDEGSANSDSDGDSEDDEYELREREFGKGNLSTMTDEERLAVKEARRVAKKASKQARAEKRKVKLPKHLKKQKIKATSGKKK